MMEEVQEVTSSPLSICSHSPKVTEVNRDGDTLTFVIVSQKLSGTGQYYAARSYEDFEWLHQHLFTQEDVPGIQGVIFPPLPAKPLTNASAKTVKQLGFLAMGQDWRPYCIALETYLQHVAAHSTLNKNNALKMFLTSSEPPGHQKMKKGIFNRLSQAVEGMRKEGHKDVDDFFKNERDHNLALTACTKMAAERFLDVVMTEQKVAMACGHFSTALQLCVGPGEDPDMQAFSTICVKMSEVFNSMRKTVESVAENNISTLGLGLDLEARYQEAEKEMLFRRTCKLVELENASRNVEKTKPVKKAAMEELKNSVEKEFHLISGVAKKEVANFQGIRVDVFRQALIDWCENQLLTARKSVERYNEHLQAFRAIA